MMFVAKNKPTQAHLSKSFVGLILLPIIGNAVEHITAITVAMKVRIIAGTGTFLFAFEVWLHLTLSGFLK